MLISRAGITSKFPTWIHMWDCGCPLLPNWKYFFLLVALQITNTKGILSEVSFTNLTVMEDKGAADPSKQFFIFVNNSSRFCEMEMPEKNGHYHT